MKSKVTLFNRWNLISREVSSTNGFRCSSVSPSPEHILSNGLSDILWIFMRRCQIVTIISKYFKSSTLLCFKFEPATLWFELNYFFKIRVWFEARQIQLAITRIRYAAQWKEETHWSNWFDRNSLFFVTSQIKAPRHVEEIEWMGNFFSIVGHQQRGQWTIYWNLSFSILL